MICKFYWTLSQPKGQFLASQSTNPSSCMMATKNSAASPSTALSMFRSSTIPRSKTLYPNPVFNSRTSCFAFSEKDYSRGLPYLHFMERLERRIPKHLHPHRKTEHGRPYVKLPQTYYFPGSSCEFRPKGNRV